MIRLVASPGHVTACCGCSTKLVSALASLKDASYCSSEIALAAAEPPVSSGFACTVIQADSDVGWAGSACRSVAAVCRCSCLGLDMSMLHERLHGCHS